jgi:hypothetical protein
VELRVCLQLGTKTRSRWEISFLVLLRALCAFSKTTDPLTKRDVAAYLGCCQRTADTTVSRLLSDKLVGRKRAAGLSCHGWCYFSSVAMLENAPDQAEEEAGETAESDASEIGEEKANDCTNADSLESEGCGERMRKPLRMFDTPQMLIPGKESAPVPVPEGVEIRSVRVASAADSDVSLSWSDALIDEHGEITVWVHGCKKPPAARVPVVDITPGASTVPTVPTVPTPTNKDAGVADLRKLFADEFGVGFTKREFPALLPPIVAALRGSPMADFVRWLVEDKLPAKRAKGYLVKPGLILQFAAEFDPTRKKPERPVVNPLPDTKVLRERLDALRKRKS